ncbi:MAG TPA: hypothetical protein EYN93_15355 [Planctomycetaceae bacterium]|nr:hypothetical protein [Planctomycetaceae bacterium]
MRVEVIYTAFEQTPVTAAWVTIGDKVQDDEVALELAFELTQNVYGSWSREENIENEVLCLEENRDWDSRCEFVGVTDRARRSSSCFDHFRIGTDLYICRPSGFELVDDESVEVPHITKRDCDPKAEQFFIHSWDNSEPGFAKKLRRHHQDKYLVAFASHKNDR